MFEPDAMSRAGTSPRAGVFRIILHVMRLFYILKFEKVDAPALLALNFDPPARWVIDVLAPFDDFDFGVATF